jgi:hypothetical protein
MTMAEQPMTNARRPGLSSAFDDMLAQTKKRFDDLYRGGEPQAGAPVARAKPFAGREAAARKPSDAELDLDSFPVRRLNERFGSDWRYEITERKRDGDEVIVLGKLTFGKDSAVRTQFGRARISGSPVAAASGGVRFKIGGSGTEQDVGQAFRRAAEAALTNCVDLI